MDMLSLFNRQVLACQDEAYTFAWYFSGDEAQAESITRAAVKDAFYIFALHGQTCRLVILKLAARLCRGKPREAITPLPPTRVLGLQVLPGEERQALILVDILCLNYSEAATVMERPAAEISHLLAQARRKMASIFGLCNTSQEVAN